MTALAIAGNQYLKIGPPRSLRLYLTFNFPIALGLIILGIFLTFTRATIVQRINAAETAQRQKESELSLLLSQLRPHFLFNTLNNLYGLSLSEHEKLPDLLLKLSNLLRYSLYETSQPYVLLRDELNYIMCYIEFEQIRLGKKMRITENISRVDAEQLRIPPMILITFVENAVKHSKKTIHNDIVINISANITDAYLHFSISNSIGNDLFPNERSASSGIGLSATIKRLDGLFGKDYQLEQYTADNYYHVKLKLKTR
ncbi:MAG: histidine kinase [Chitinophaga sp.]|uniref:sensor histidine kinase n=1 Tax=Chitinophaga sp. TaxID=1869181 RepID=UPI001B23D008|nr:histidine kinase [Chitinophaga sp.]MBO9731491.1 histidine kinase [Chitinophaga sp.]